MDQAAQETFLLQTAELETEAAGFVTANYGNLITDAGHNSDGTLAQSCTDQITATLQDEQGVQQVYINLAPMEPNAVTLQPAMSSVTSTITRPAQTQLALALPGGGVQLVQVQPATSFALNVNLPNTSNITTLAEQLSTQPTLTSSQNVGIMETQKLNAGMRDSSSSAPCTSAIREECSHPRQVFSNVKATLSAALLQAIPGSKEAVLRQLQNDCQINIEHDSLQNTFMINGNVEQILKAHQNLSQYVHATELCDVAESHLSSLGLHSVDKRGFQNSNSEPWNQSSVAKSDKGVLCEILRPQFSRAGREVKLRNMDPYNVLLPSSDKETLEPKSRAKPHWSKRKRGRRKKEEGAEEDTRVESGASEEKDKAEKSDVVEDDPGIENGGQKTHVPLTEPTMPASQLAVAVDGSSELQPPMTGEELCNLTDAHSTSEKENEQADLPENVQMLKTEPLFAATKNLEMVVTSQVQTTKGLKLGRVKPKKDYEAMLPFKYFCSKCSFKTKRESHLAKHRKVHEKDLPLLKCNRCGFTTIRLSHLRRHELMHSSEKFNCPECKYTTDNRRLLSRHIRSKHNMTKPKDVVLVYECPKCEYKTVRAYQFKRHLRCHVELPNGGTAEGTGIISEYQCELCPYKTQRKEHYLRHISNVHSDARPYLCDLCGKAFKRADALRQHKVIHSDKTSRAYPYKCVTCMKGFRSQAHLNEHRTIHSNVRAYLCEICGASFKTRSVQRKHVISIHRNPRAFLCDQCDKRFNTKYALIRHQRTHDTPGMRISATLAGGSNEGEIQLNVVQEGEVPMQLGVVQPQVVGPEMAQPQAQPVQTIQTVSTQPLTQETIQATTAILENLEQQTDANRQVTQATYLPASEATTALLYLTNFHTY